MVTESLTDTIDRTSSGMNQCGYNYSQCKLRVFGNTGEGGPTGAFYFSTHSSDTLFTSQQNVA